MAEARTLKWKKVKNNSFSSLTLDAKSLFQHCHHAIYLAYLVLNPSLKYHPSLPLRHGWELVGGRCHPLRHTQPALPMHLPAPGQAEESEKNKNEEEDEEEEHDGAQRRREK